MSQVRVGVHSPERIWDVLCDECRMDIDLERT